MLRAISEADLGQILDPEEATTEQISEYFVTLEPCITLSQLNEILDKLSTMEKSDECDYDSAYISGYDVAVSDIRQAVKQMTEGES